MAPLPTIHLLRGLTSALSLLPSTLPTRTLAARQSTVTVVADPSSGGNDDPDDASTLTGGAIAGIVIGSVAGFLLVAWIVRSCTNLGAPPGDDDAVPGRPWYGGVRDEYPPRHVSRRRSWGRRSRSRSRSVSVSRGGYRGLGYGYHGHHNHHHHHNHGRRSKSVRRSAEVVVPVAEVPPAASVVIRDEGRRGGGYYGYGEAPVRASRSRSRGRY
ncbi:hypothetical protein VTK26DRAFT_8728 [Humicola hyalothermophila]